MKKLRVAVVGATGLVGQRLLVLLKDHPFFTVTALCAGPISVGKPYREAVKNRWGLSAPIPEYAAEQIVLPAEPNLLGDCCDLVFCAVKLPASETLELEESLAKRELFVVSLNSANRLVEDVPMVIPEINAGHLVVIPAQKRRLKTSRGFIVTKCNCALLSYVPLLTPLLSFGLQKVYVTTLQAVSGAGKTLSDAAELDRNVLPFIRGEEEKCETEPLKLWGSAVDGRILPLRAPNLRIKAQCFRVPVENGHFASVFATFDRTPKLSDLYAAWEGFNRKVRLPLPTAPEQFIRIFEEDDRPQPALDLLHDKGMSILCGRIKCDPCGIHFSALSHNTVRGAAGGALLLAEFLYSQNYIY